MSLDAFFRPKSVAVIGASTDPGKLGHAVVQNLIEGGFVDQGRRVYPINPKAETILGLQAFPEVGAVADSIDLAVIVIPYPAVPAALETCGKKGVPAAIVISAGFREAGREGLARELELVDIASRYAVRLIGPNCLGVIDTVTPLNASFSAGMPPGGPMAFMSQSGALGTAILDWALAGQLGMSKFVSLGNKADVSEIDLLDAWADDPDSRVILIYTEGLPDGRAFLRAARRASKLKPVVAVKSGVTQAGSRAVSSHTGSLAGSEQAYRAAFRQAGVIRAESMEHLFDLARAFAHLPPLRGDRVAIVTNAGGPGILATDALERAGLRLARFQPEVVRSLETRLPDAASAANPVDVLGDARADRYAFALDQVVAAEGVDAVLVILTPQAMTEIDATAQVVAEAFRRAALPVMTCFMGEARIQSGLQILDAAHVPNYPFPERAAAVLADMRQYAQFQARPDPKIEAFKVDRKAAEATLAQARSEGRVALGDSDARALLAAYGIPIPDSRLATSPDEAVEFASQIGYPVVLKIASPDILHKTDAGGVKVGLDTPAAVRDAFDLITYRAQRYFPEARISGCQVQKMVPSGLETLIGMNRDPQFGPLVTFGLGGIYVEVLKDVTFQLAPFSKDEALEMLAGIRAHALIDGVRGQPPADKEAIVDALLRIGQMVTDLPEIAELDINPFVAYEQGQGGVAIDMRLVLTTDKPGPGPTVPAGGGT
jgi:acetate---CoA ligase (ADP-forming)